MSTHQLPAHLTKYVVDQDYSRYTPEDQAVWRYILRQLFAFLSKNAHSVYAEGLKKTGISIDCIPKIEDISAKLQEFGWKAVPVSGFIPPAAFMEFQALGYLPIASDMRTIEHMAYTPAPDIVHEAAGHAPIIADPEYASYLKEYADVAKRAILSKEDMDLYEAIRELSDIKEDPNSSAELIQKCEDRLTECARSMSGVSEAAALARMNWWTAEYGLVGDINEPKIFGAGLLSSVGESYTCLDDTVKKIPLSVNCVEYSYDITEKQPHLFVAEDFSHLKKVLRELSDQMSYKRGSLFGLRKAQESMTVNTVELSSGLQISGVLQNITLNTEDPNQVDYLQFTGQCQLSCDEVELPGHGRDFHSEGYGTTVGFLKNNDTAIEDMNSEELSRAGILEGQSIHLEFRSGVNVSGTLKKITRNGSKNVLLSFSDCSVHHGDKTLFAPEWGIYDMALGTSIPSVFGGPADRGKYGETEDFVAKIIPRREFSDVEKKRHWYFVELQKLREAAKGNFDRQEIEDQLQELTLDLSADPNDWLILLEMYELTVKAGLSQKIQDRMKYGISVLAEKSQTTADYVQAGIDLIEELPLLHS